MAAAEPPLGHEARLALFFTTKRPGGARLGRAICRDIVRTDGGDLRVANGQGRGTTFTAWIPAASGVPSAAPLRPVPTQTTPRIARDEET